MAATERKRFLTWNVTFQALEDASNPMEAQQIRSYIERNVLGDMHQYLEAEETSKLSKRKKSSNEVAASKSNEEANKSNEVAANNEGKEGKEDCSESEQ